MHELWPPPPVGPPISDKLSWATACHAAAGDALRDDPALSLLLRDASLALDRARAALLASGMVDICRSCEEGGGSCCGAGIENRYGPVLLLINLLLDVELPESRMDPLSCHFLGPRGCLLRAREVICVNYVCRAVTEKLEPGKLTALREHEGVALDAQFRLEQRLSTLLPDLLASSSGMAAGCPEPRV
jgi:hypothetical protein